MGGSSPNIHDVETTGQKQTSTSLADKNYVTNITKDYEGGVDWKNIRTGDSIGGSTLNAQTFNNGGNTCLGVGCTAPPTPAPSVLPAPT